jgi:hypothetical protein
LNPSSDTSFQAWGPGDSIPADVQDAFDIFGPPPPKNPEQEACYNSWYSYLYDESDPNNLAFKNSSTTTSVLVFETIQSFGPNSTYTDCDGIPRIAITEPPTRYSTSFATVTVSRDSGFFELNYSSKEPQCSKLDPYHCHLLRGAARDEIGPGIKSGSRPIGDAPSWLCPGSSLCNANLDEVVLIYWPEYVVTRNVCASNGHGSSVTRPWGSRRGTVFTTDAITFRGQDLYLRTINGQEWEDYYRSGNVTDPGYEERDEVWHATALPVLSSALSILTSTSYPLVSSVLRGDWRFTSPTVYLAHRPITGVQWSVNLADKPEEQFTYFRQTFIQTGGIIPLKPEDIFSLRINHQNDRIGGVSVAQLIANGSFHPALKAQYDYSVHETHSFNFGDLQNPVPASVYYDARSKDCWGQQSHCGTITDDAYRPKIRLARSIWESLYKSLMCEDPMLVDPPISLHPLRELKLPQLPNVAEPLTSAGPISGHSQSPSGPPASSAGIASQPPRPGQGVAPPLPVQTAITGRISWLGLPGLGKLDERYRSSSPRGAGNSAGFENGGRGSGGISDNKQESTKDRTGRRQGSKGSDMFTGQSPERYATTTWILCFSLALTGVLLH